MKNIYYVSFLLCCIIFVIFIVVGYKFFDNIESLLSNIKNFISQKTQQLSEQQTTSKLSQQQIQQPPIQQPQIQQPQIQQPPTKLPAQPQIQLPQDFPQIDAITQNGPISHNVYISKKDNEISNPLEDSKTGQAIIPEKPVILKNKHDNKCFSLREHNKGCPYYMDGKPYNCSFFIQSPCNDVTMTIEKNNWNLQSLIYKPDKTFSFHDHFNNCIFVKKNTWTYNQFKDTIGTPTINFYTGLPDFKCDAKSIFQTKKLSDGCMSIIHENNCLGVGSPYTTNDINIKGYVTKKCDEKDLSQHFIAMQPSNYKITKNL